MAGNGQDRGLPRGASRRRLAVTPVQLSLKFDLRSPAGATPAPELYRTALAQCEWADAAGFHSVHLPEHHGSEDGYCPSPLVVAAAIAGRTEHMRIKISALVLPLHDPVRIAEDCVVVDQLSRGRLELVIAGGYVRQEFDMFGKDIGDRPKLVEEGVMAMKQAWSGKPFSYRGRPAHVALRAVQRPHPPIILGGSSKAAARRAARIADGFMPTRRALFDEYRAECARLGRPAGDPPPPRPAGQFLYVTRDPERAWRALGPHLLHEMRSYGKLLADAGTGAQFRPVANIAELRASGTYVIVTPDECVALARDVGPIGQLIFHPLVGGADPELGWSCLQLFHDEVLPVLRREGFFGRDAVVMEEQS